MAKKTSEKSMVINIKRPVKKTLKLKIIGESPLHVHRLGKKAKEELDNTAEGKKAKKRKPRNYQEEFMDSIYFTDGKGNMVETPDKIIAKTHFGFPASGLKKAMVSAARHFSNITMTEMKQVFHVDGYMIEIEGKPELEEYWRRIGGRGAGTGTADRGIRAIFKKWSANVVITYIEDLITPESIANLLDMAGFCVGLGEDRPEKNGNKGGMWRVS